MAAKLILPISEMEKSREKWLELRNTGIGGSDAAAICGMSPWKSIFQLWLEKTGQADPEDLSDNEPIYWGNVLEDVVAREFTKRTGKKVQRRGLMQSVEYPFLLASVDRILVSENAGLECKTASGFKAKLWEGDEIPDAYYCQCQHYMMVTGCDKWYIAVLIGGQRFVWKEVPRCQPDIDMLLTQERIFWEENVTQNIMPPVVDGSDSCRIALGKAYKGGDTEPIELSKNYGEMFDNIERLKAQIDICEKEIELNKNKLRQAMGNHENAILRDEKGATHRITWKTQNGRATFDSKALKRDYPQTYEQYLKAGKPTRVLRIY